MADKIIDRETYRKIKKMSREELQAFLMRYADNLRACLKSQCVRIFKHNFAEDKEKIRRHTVVWQGFLT